MFPLGGKSFGNAGKAGKFPGKAADFSRKPLTNPASHAIILICVGRTCELFHANEEAPEEEAAADTQEDSGTLV